MSETTPTISSRRTRGARSGSGPVDAPAQAQDAVDPAAETTTPPPVEAEAASAVGWLRDMRQDAAARRARSRRRGASRWMREQPTSVADHLDFYLRQRERRPFGRRGWGLATAIPAVNGVHAALYVAYGVTVGLAVTLAAYALAWIAQRPGRFLLLLVAACIVRANLSTWLAGS